MKTVSFLASGRGSNFFNVANAILQGEIQAQPGILITSKKNAGALQFADDLNFPSYPLSWKEEGSRDNFEKKALAKIREAGTDLVVCAGYMKILSPDFIREFKNRIINIHPALLPSFPGIHAQKQALDYGVKVAGCTVHFIDDGVDTGPIILQQSVPVLEDDDEDSLTERILKEEHRLLKEGVKLFCEGRLRIEGRKVKILEKAILKGK